MKKKTRGKNHLRINIMRSQALYRAAQGLIHVGYTLGA